MLEGYLTDAGLDLADLGSFKQRGDPEINAVSPQSIYEAGLEIGGGDSEALFISCTGLRTSGLVGTPGDCARQARRDQQPGAGLGQPAAGRLRAAAERFRPAYGTGRRLRRDLHRSQTRRSRL